MDTSTTLNATNGNKQIERNYKLALKQFINKSFPLAFRLSHQLYRCSFAEYRQGTISHNLLVKIISLYLVVTGVCLKDHRLDAVQANVARNSISSNEVTNLIRSIWDARVPCEIMYNFHLMMISNRDLISDEAEYIRDVVGSVARLDAGDKYAAKLRDLAVFEILPVFNRFDDAAALLAGDGDDDAEAREKLARIKTESQDRERRVELKRLEDEKRKSELREREANEARKLARESQLKYRSIREIQSGYSTDDKRESVVKKKKSRGNGREDLVVRLKYLTRLVMRYMERNYMVLIVLAILVFGSMPFLKRADLRERFVETVKMAFKFTYV
ncbi:uncharacterized protein LODBEIA_P49410 [Lodderomyces beijingensis]|uniref:Uncharacterized protein n=1 Tax=Lodderomyces beijingensis TaxID=1775926 RepID=A0ABP0ZTL5_9ASCO